MGQHPYLTLAVWVSTHTVFSNPPFAMKMTIEIPEDVLAEVMLLAGKKTKREAVEFALREAARRAKQRRLFSEGLQLTPAQIEAEATPKPSDLLDAPDIDWDAVKRANESAAKRRLHYEKWHASGGTLNEPGANYGGSSPESE
jgi:Arc/MetJ family transcription regulator